MTQDQWTPTITARRELAELLLLQPDKYLAAGILESDLQTIIREGRLAEAADAEQKEQLAEGAAIRAGRKSEIDALLVKEQLLRSVAIAVVHDLLPGHPAQARFLRSLSFARFRVRELAQPAGDPDASADDTAEVKAVEWVEREDQMTRARNLGRYCQALLRPGREVVRDQFAARKIDTAMLEQITRDAAAFADAGRNTIKAAEATAREATAVAAQKATWRAVRRLVRVAVRGDRALEAKYTEC
jgi:hypothetical protein